MWHRRPEAGLIIRASGLALLAISAVAARSLLTRAGTPPATQDALAYLLALIAFLCGSVGCAMAFVGVHLFDEVEVSPRWRRLS